MNYNIEEIRSNVYLITAPTNYEISSMFLRPQEFYESNFPNIQNNYFTLEEYIDTYVHATGAFTYYNDWAGFNISSYHIKQFFNKFAYNLSKKEIILLELLKKINPELTDPFYVIGTKHQDAKSINHELAHAYYYLNTNYRAYMEKESLKFSLSLWDKLNCNLQENYLYNKNVIRDEAQAYLATSSRQHCLTLFNWEDSVKVPSSFRKFFKNFDASQTIINKKELLF
jgi:hypothetical protein